MTQISKPWDWAKNSQDIWNEPSEESYYLLNRWKNKQFQDFLDLGCGLGRHSLLFSQAGFNVNSFDLSAEAISGLMKKSAERGLSNISCAVGDMNELPYADASIDCLLAYHVISHTDSRGIRKILGEIKRVLKPSGEFFLTLCSKNSWSFQKAGYPKHDDNTIIKVEDGPENGIPHFYSDEETVRELFKGFRLVNMKHVNDLVFGEKELRDSWHYFILGEKE
jgi:ubiquinone/menaquinone biosynthesis C-methylase UbiE